jgi:hypothetical protein
LARVKKCLNKKTDFDAVLAEKMQQLKLPAVQSIRITVDEAQDFPRSVLLGRAAFKKPRRS